MAEVDRNGEIKVAPGKHGELEFIIFYLGNFTYMRLRVRLVDLKGNIVDEMFYIKFLAWQFL